MGDAMAEAVALAERLGAPVVNSYLHNDSFPASHPQWCGPLGYQGSKAAMKLIAKADVVLALGTRLGPFGTLPQHDMDYWPKDAKIIQVDADHKMLGLVKPISSASTAMPVPPPKHSSSDSTAGPSSATQRATPAPPPLPRRRRPGKPNSTSGPTKKTTSRWT